jgi:predicted lactoylglutathione lyase
MPTKIFVNLPVKDLDRSMEFFKKLGFSFNPQFTDETAACMVISDDIYAMLLTHKKFGEFTKKKIVDATEMTEVLIALSQESRAEVDRFADAALAAGGKAAREPKDHGFMYERAVEDPDGHIWEIFWMDPSAVAKS